MIKISRANFENPTSVDLTLEGRILIEHENRTFVYYWDCEHHNWVEMV